ncbi:hypothetical protein QTO34_019232 [Cnephaeus nilssonii]|uniref:AT-rich interactive domain-containing protein 3 n=1 Tax=Cnephaeus nilssonii TaxID=3371016 RepID=A0AA40LNV2_CNENI|nr:hypothetical protein QTO34_019232 [Eptesicus nilssonii]
MEESVELPNNLKAVAIAGCELAKAFSELRQTGIEKEMDLGPMLPGDQFGCIIRLLSYDRSVFFSLLDDAPLCFSLWTITGTPINRIPIMAKQILDLYMLYKLVTEKGGLVEIINKKIWREITKGLNLPTSITSAAFTLRTQYMKYLYAYECEKKALSSPAELQAAIDGNRREGRRPSYSSSLFGYSPTATAAATRAPALLSTPKIRFPVLGLGSSSGASGCSPRISPATPLRKGDGVPVTTVPVPNRLAAPMTLTGQQASTRMATLEQLRERLESGEPPEKKASRLSRRSSA